VAGDMPWNSPKRLSYWNSTSGFDFDYITAVDMSLCTNLRNFIQIGPPSAQKMTSCRFSRWRISAILGFRGPIMGSLKSPCTTSYRSSIDTVALNCLVFLRKSRFCNLATDRQTDEQTNRCTRPLHEAALALASGGLIRNWTASCSSSTSPSYHRCCDLSTQRTMIVNNRLRPSHPVYNSWQHVRCDNSQLCWQQLWSDAKVEQETVY